MLSKKDIVEANKDFDKGTIMNENSLDYAVATQARSKNWLRTAAVFTRSILIDHAFADGNKRTTAAIIMGLMELNKIDYDPEKIPRVVQFIANKNLHNIRQIERQLKNVIRIY